VMLSEGRVSHDLPLAAFARLAGYTAAVDITLGAPVELAVARQTLAILPAVDPAQVGHGPVDEAGRVRTVTFPVQRWSAELLVLLGSALHGFDVEDIAIREVDLEESFAVATARSAADVA